MAATLTLGLGIGAVTAVFSVANAILFRPLPWPDPDRLVSVYAVFPERRSDPAARTSWNQGLLGWPEWQQIREVEAFDRIAAWHGSSAIVGENRTEIVPVAYTSASLLQLLGADLALGRHFTPEEDIAAPYVVVLSFETWRRRFGGRTDVIGTPVHLAFPAPASPLHPHIVVGVLSRPLTFDGQSPEFFLPTGLFAPSWRERAEMLRVIARLGPGAGLDVALQMTEPIVRGPETPERKSARLVSFTEEYSGAARGRLPVLFGAAAVLLLVSCSNVAGLLLSEARIRRHELGVRVSLGASRGRLLRQLALEHAILGIAGATLGLALGSWLTPLFQIVVPGDVTGGGGIPIDLRVAGFAAVLGLLTALVFGIAPTLMLSGTAVNTALSESAPEAARRHVAHRIVVAAQLALSMVLVVAGTLLGETLVRLESQPLGFDPSNLVVVTTTVTRSTDLGFNPAIRYGSDADMRAAATRQALEGRALHEDGLLQRITAIPGVISAAATNAAPFLSMPAEQPLRIEGRTGGLPAAARFHHVSPRFLSSLRIPVLKGRDFLPSDRWSRAVIVSQSFETRYLDGDAIGRRFVPAESSSEPYVVIGVVPNVRVQELTEPEQPTYYRLGTLLSHLMVRTAADPAGSIAAIRQAIAEYDPQTVVTMTTTMSDRLGRTVAEERLRALLAGAFGATALALAGMGLYALAARRVADRRREIGIRMALGARPADIKAMVLRDSVRLVGLGLALGLPSAFAAAQVLRGLLFGVTPWAPHVFVAATVVLVGAASVAVILPTVRASRVDPITALRE